MLHFSLSAATYMYAFDASYAVLSRHSTTYNRELREESSQDGNTCGKLGRSST